MKDHALSQGQKIAKWWIYYDDLKKSFPPEPVDQFKPNMVKLKHHWWWEFQFVQTKDPFFQKEDNDSFKLCFFSFNQIEWAGIIIEFIYT